MNQLTEDQGQCIIDGKTYRIYTDDEGKQHYSRDYLTEPPYEGGAPPFLNEPMFTFHGGALKSKQGVVGTYDYGDSDPRWAFKLLPGQELVTADGDADTNGVEPYGKVVEVFGYIWFMTGLKIYRCDPSTGELFDSKVIASNLFTDLAVWEDGSGNTALYATTSAATQSLYKLELGDIVVGGPDNWTNTADVVACFLAVGVSRMFKIDQSGILKNIAAGIDPMTEANWADEVPVGSPATTVRSLIAYENSVLIGKTDGLYGVSEEGIGTPLISSPPIPTSFYNPFRWGSYLMVPHANGLYRWIPGSAESVGIEKEILNKRVFGRIVSMTTDGYWLYAVMTLYTNITFPVGGSSYDNIFLYAKPREEGEPGFGPLTWYTMGFSTTMGVVHYSTATNPPRLWFFGRGLSGGLQSALSFYIALPSGGGVPTVARGFGFGSPTYHYTYAIDFGDRRSKTLYKIIVDGKNIDATSYVDIAYELDDSGTFVTTDVNGSNMRKTTSGLSEFIVATSAVAQSFRFQLTLNYDGSGEPPEVTYLEAVAKPRTIKTPVYSVVLVLEDDTRLLGSIEDRTPDAQLLALQALQDQAAVVTASGPWGDSKSVFIRGLELAQFSRGELGQKNMLVQVTMHERETS